MDKFSAVVYTPGRTGSQALVEALSKRFKSPWIYVDKTNNINGLIHTHNPEFVLPNNNFKIIISRRHSVFDAIMSHQVALITRECTRYSNKKIVPQLLDLDAFEYCYFYQKMFYMTIDRRAFTDAIDVYYEDMINDPEYLFKLFGISNGLNSNTQRKKSPYNYYEIFTNIAELTDLFQVLEKVPVSEDRLQKFLEENRPRWK